MALAKVMLAAERLPAQPSAADWVVPAGSGMGLVDIAKIRCLLVATSLQHAAKTP